jgi:hypothetical protein
MRTGSDYMPPGPVCSERYGKLTEKTNAWGESDSLSVGHLKQGPYTGTTRSLDGMWPSEYALHPGMSGPPQTEPIFGKDHFHLAQNSVDQRQGDQQAQNGKSDTASASKDHKTVTITRANGSVEIRSGGWPAWRNNNPGNLRGSLGAFGSIGKNGTYLIFSNYQDGYNGLISDLKSQKNQKRIISKAIEKYAPIGDGKNDPEIYIKHIEKWTGLKGTDKMSSLTQKQLTSLAVAIIRQEGTEKGVVTIKESTGIAHINQ